MVVKSQIASSVVRLLRQFDPWDAFAMQLPDRLRLPFTFAPELLARDLQGLKAVAWLKHFVAQNYEGDGSATPRGGKAGPTHPVMMIYSDPSCRDFADTPMLAACPYYRQVLAALAAPPPAGRRMRLAPPPGPQQTGRH